MGDLGVCLSSDQGEGLYVRWVLEVFFFGWEPETLSRFKEKKGKATRLSDLVALLVYMEMKKRKKRTA